MSDQPPVNGTPATSNASAQTNGDPRPTASSLPPEALALATKLFDFAREGKTEELSQYLTAGIPKNLCNHKGDSLLMLAAYHGHIDTVKMLLAQGADTEMLNERGQSIVAGAVFKGYDEIVKVLFDAGAQIEAGHPTAVDTARMFRRTDVLSMFGVPEQDGQS